LFFKEKRLIVRISKLKIPVKKPCPYKSDYYSQYPSAGNIKRIMNANIYLGVTNKKCPQKKEPDPRPGIFS
jgi:hypothetical protein